MFRGAFSGSCGVGFWNGSIMSPSEIGWQLSLSLSLSLSPSLSMPLSRSPSMYVSL